MENESIKILKNLEIFFKGNLQTFDDIFMALKSVIEIESGSIYYASPELLRLEYTFKDESVPKEISLSKSESQNIFSSDKPLNKAILKYFPQNTNIYRLAIDKTVYGILAFKPSRKNTQDAKVIYELCAQIISNLIKELELSQIMKMQTESLQKGITEIEKANRIIKKQNKKIIASDKIKTEFMSNISHELRTPLNSIIGFSELLMHPKTGKLNNKQKEFIKDIQSEGIQLLGMINEILDMTKIESGTVKLNLREFDINQAITETLNILKPLYDKKRIKINLECENIIIKADYLKIRQILFNIVSNGIKYSPIEGIIEIKAKASRKNLQIRIKDNGCGIEKKFHRKIFKKFEQIDAKENSTGLGLTITKELVKLHGGKIKLNSEKDKGAEFLIILPIS